MAVAFDHGINVFDTARSYGYGESEAIVGEFVRDRRDRVVVCTKAGIRSQPVTPMRQRLKATARRVFSFAPWLRTALRAPLGRQHSPGHFDPTEVRASVEESLRELHTDRIDLLFLHDVPADQANRDDLIALMEALRAEGKVLLGGPSATPTTLTALAADRRTALGQAVQFSVCAAGWKLWPADFVRFVSEGNPSRTVRIGNQLFGGGGTLDPPFESQLKALGPRYEALLRLPLAAGICDVVVTSMIQAEHIIANCRAILAPIIPAAALDTFAASLLPTGKSSNDAPRRLDLAPQNRE